MSSVLDELAAQLSPQTIRAMSAQIGAAPQQTASAIETALPLMLGQLERNASTPQGANALLGALDRDHDGSILDDLAGFLGSGPSASNERSLDHIFGGKKGTVESAVARRSGLDMGQVMKLMAMLAPLLLGILGRQKSSAGGGMSQGGGLGDLIGGMLGGGGSGGGGNILSDLLGGATGRMQQQQPGLGGMLGGLLDRDGDGSVMDDLLEQGLGGGGAQRQAPQQQGGGDDLLGGLLGSLLGGRR
jgi:hypothetical protein